MISDTLICDNVWSISIRIMSWIEFVELSDEFVKSWCLLGELFGTEVNFDDWLVLMEGPLVSVFSVGGFEDSEFLELPDLVLVDSVHN